MKVLWYFTVCLVFYTFLLGQDTSAVHRVACLIAHEGFRDEELAVPREAFNEEGFEVVVVSTDTSLASGMLGMKVKPDITIEQWNVMDYDAILLIGGVGASVYFDDKHVHDKLKEAFESGKVIGAICIAPVTLAKAGLLKGKRATSFPSVASELSLHGAIYEGDSLAVDGKIVTADGPKSAPAFAQKIIELLKGN